MHPRRRQPARLQGHALPQQCALAWTQAQPTAEASFLARTWRHALELRLCQLLPPASSLAGDPEDDRDWANSSSEATALAILDSIGLVDPQIVSLACRNESGVSRVVRELSERDPHPGIREGAARIVRAFNLHALSMVGALAAGPHEDAEEEASTSPAPAAGSASASPDDLLQEESGASAIQPQKAAESLTSTSQHIRPGWKRCDACQRECAQSSKRCPSEGCMARFVAKSRKARSSGGG